jgi:SAM-dependent methyltransferase
MPDLAAYYAHAYTILIDSEEEDQLYQVVGGRRVMRVEHQVRTLQAKLPLPPGARVLDFGCAKSATMKGLLAERPDLAVHLFDVSDMYVPFWERFLPPERWATHQLPEAWRGSFDAVTSFFAMEHVADPRAMARDLASLLKPGGRAYLIVPNTYVNTADFIVLDHVNHFGARSLQVVMAAAGFGDVEIDAEAHFGAWVVSATLAAPERAPEPLALDAARGLATYWAGIGDRVRRFEREAGGGPAAIYGSGFYGTFLATCLAAPERVACFLDQNPFRQGKRLMDRPILPPEALPRETEVVYVGLNPAVAEANIAQVAAFRDRPRRFCFL